MREAMSHKGKLAYLYGDSATRRQPGADLKWTDLLIFRSDLFNTNPSIFNIMGTAISVNFEKESLYVQI